MTVKQQERSEDALVRRRAPPLYDMTLNPPYFVDYISLCTGKLVHQSKRRVRFRFGFSDAEALAAGFTGVECRGQEHEVTLIWSHASGKICVVANGRELYYNVAKRSQGKFQFIWSMFGDHVLKIVAHAAPPLRRKLNWRQFDLQLDGQSVFDMPKIYELGVKVGGETEHIVPYAKQDSSPYCGDDNYSQSPYKNYDLSNDDLLAWVRCVETHENIHGMDDESAPPAEVPVSSDQQSTSLVQPEEIEWGQQQAPEQPLPMIQDFLSCPLPGVDDMVQEHFTAPIAILDRPSPILHITPYPAAAPQQESSSLSMLSTSEEVATRNVLEYYGFNDTPVAGSAPAQPCHSHFEMLPQSCFQQAQNGSQYAFLPSSATISAPPPDAFEPSVVNTNSPLSVPALYEATTTSPQQNYQYSAPSYLAPDSPMSSDTSFHVNNSAVGAGAEPWAMPAPVAADDSFNASNGFVLPPEDVMNEVDHALKNLVNLGNINECKTPDYEEALFGADSKPASKPTAHLSAMKFEERNNHVPAYRKKASFHSRGLPSTASSWAMQNKPLCEVQATAVKKHAAKEVMRT